METDVEYIDLYDLQVLLKQGVAQIFPEALWVRAEIASIGLRTNGHCYLELSQSDRSGVVAKTRAVIWKSSWPFISQYFKSVTGKDLSAGQEVLVRVKVGYHEVFGMSLTIDQIAPEFTVGARELLRKQTIDRLEKEGLIELQKELCLPDLPYWLAVISAPDAAGLGDFRRHLLENENGYAYQLDLFEAVMQGEKAPSSICTALEEIGSSKVRYDAVLIMRGGGSDLDLDCFDDYGLAVAIARFPVPVFTAIGHDRDYHVADMVANRYVKTPTALADLFLDCSAAEDERISLLESRLAVSFATRLKALDAALDNLDLRLGHALVRRLEAVENALSRAEDAITRGIRNKLTMASDRCENIATYILKMALNSIERAEIKLASIDMRISSADPRKVLLRGIPVVENSRGRKDTVAADYSPGDPVKVFLRDGKLDCIVQRVSLDDSLSAANTA